MYFPESVPALSTGLISSWSTLSYPDLVKQIMKLFIHQDEIPSLELGNLSIYFACLSVWVSFVYLYPINVKTAKRIGPIFFVGPHVTQGKV